MIKSCVIYSFFWGSQKLIIDQKSYYLFGRNKEVCDFSLEHTSCSRVHAALVFHRHLNRSFLIDLKSSKFLGLCNIFKGQLIQGKLYAKVVLQSIFLFTNQFFLGRLLLVSKIMVTMIIIEMASNCMTLALQEATTLHDQHE